MKYTVTPILFAFVLFSSAVVAQNRETRNVDTFTKIAYRIPGKLHLRQGSPQKVELEGDKSVLQKIETEVSGGKLTIGTERKWNNWGWHKEDEINVYITVKDIDALNVSGSGDLIAETKLTGNTFDLAVSGSGNIDAEIDASGDLSADVSGSGNIQLKGNCKNFESHVSGSGDVVLSETIAETADLGVSGSGKIKASGKAQTVKATVSGSGEVLAANLETDKCNVRISGSGEVEINVKNELDASIAGSGSVSYRGNPSHVNSHSAGSGSIRKM